MNSKNRTILVVVAVVGVAVLAALAAVLISSDDDSGTTSAGTAAGTTPPPFDGDVVGETFPVGVTGDPLPPMIDGAADQALGLATPVADGSSFDASPVTIGGPTDNPTLYVFLAHWCPHCNDEIPELIELHENGELPDGLDVVGISTAVTPDQPNYPPSQWMLDKGWPWPVMADDENATSFVVFGGSGFPYSLLADADGSVLDRAAGSRPASEIKSWLEGALSSSSV